MPNTEVKLLSADGSRAYVPLEQDVARQVRDRKVSFLCLKINRRPTGTQSISYGERMILCEEKAIEADELRKERNEFSRAK